MNIKGMEGILETLTNIKGFKEILMETKDFEGLKGFWGILRDF